MGFPRLSKTDLTGGWLRPTYGTPPEVEPTPDTSTSDAPALNLPVLPDGLYWHLRRATVDERYDYAHFSLFTERPDLVVEIRNKQQDKVMTSVQVASKGNTAIIESEANDLYERYQRSVAMQNLAERERRQLDALIESVNNEQKEGR